MVFVLIRFSKNSGKPSDVSKVMIDGTVVIEDADGIVKRVIELTPIEVERKVELYLKQGSIQLYHNGKFLRHYDGYRTLLARGDILQVNDHKAYLLESE